MIKQLKVLVDDFVGNKHEISESFDITLEDRTTSPFYGYFAISWIIVNWDFLYAAFFVSQDNIFEVKELLRLDYLLQEILPPSYSFQYFLQFLILPFIFTCIAFWIMPIVTNKFYRKYIKNKRELEIIKIQETVNKRKAETELLEAESEKAKVEKEVAIINPEILWYKEYEDFKKTNLFKRFKYIRDAVYKHKGEIKIVTIDKNFGFENVDFEIDTQILVYADSNDIINTNGGKIALTPKGKYFMKLYSKEKIL